MAPRGRPAVPKAPTKFLNSKRRVIYMTADGKYIAKSAKGATVYGPKARFVKSPGGTERNVKNSSARVPTAIRAKAVRKVRKNRGVARMKTGQVYRKAIGPKRPAGRPRKYIVTPGRNMGIAGLFGNKPIRKLRKNSGMKRGPRVPKAMLGANPFAKLM